MIEDGRDYLVYINYTLLNLPKIISRILPFALFFSFSYVLARYEGNNELIVFWNYGVEKIEVINFFVKFSIIIMILQIFLNSFIVPKTQDMARSFLRTSSVDFLDNFIKPKKFNDTIKGLTIYAEDKDKDGNLKNIYLKKVGDNKNQITFAKKGRFEIKKGAKILVLIDGQTINEVNKKISNFSFLESDFNFIDLKTNTITTVKTQETSTIKLINCIKDLNTLNQKNSKDKNNIIALNCSNRNINNVYTELYKRIIVPFYIPILMIISLLHIVRSKESINYFKYRVILFLIGFLLIILSESSLKIIEDDIISNIKFIVMPLIILAITYAFLFYNLRFKFIYKKT
jgi:lipopolysaccharide export system permease protein